MPDISSLFKSEIARLSKKTVRQHVEPLRAAATAHRHQLAALKKQVAQLERELAKLRRVAAPKAAPVAETPAEGGKIRFVAKGFKSLRSRLGLSAEELGRLIGVSTQTIYNWEAKKTVPRASQVGAIAALRGLGKKEAAARLELLAGAETKGSEPAAKPRAGRKPRSTKASGATAVTKPGRKPGRKPAPSTGKARAPTKTPRAPRRRKASAGS